MKSFMGLTADGRSVKLTTLEARFVLWLLDPINNDQPHVLRGSGWTTAIATAAAYERAGYEGNGPYGWEIAAQLRQWLVEKDNDA